MKLLGEVPRASWFPAIFVGVPSCQTDWLFTNDPVNQKSPSKARSLCESVTGMNPLERDLGVVRRRKSWRGEEQWKLERIKVLAQEAHCFGGTRVTTEWWANACACHTCVRQNHKRAALPQTWHFCLKEISEPTVAISPPLYFPEWEFEPCNQDYYSANRGFGWRFQATP